MPPDDELLLGELVLDEEELDDDCDGDEDDDCDDDEDEEGGWGMLGLLGCDWLWQPVRNPKINNVSKKQRSI